jgi:hypothetical protein
MNSRNYLNLKCNKMPTISLAQVQAAQPGWFSKSNKRFFGDKRYTTRQGKQSKKTYLVRSTTMWSGMCGGRETLVYRINTVDQETHKIGSLIDEIFTSRAQV